MEKNQLWKHKSEYQGSDEISPNGFLTTLLAPHTPKYLSKKRTDFKTEPALHPDHPNEAHSQAECREAHLIKAVLAVVGYEGDSCNQKRK